MNIILLINKIIIIYLTYIILMGHRHQLARMLFFSQIKEAMSTISY
jgi:hypothetical protein